MGALVGEKRMDSPERSFLKGLVSKRLEEMTSGEPPVDPLELLGLTSSDLPPLQSSSAKIDVSPVVIEEPGSSISVGASRSEPPVGSATTEPSLKSTSSIQSVCAESVAQSTDSATVKLVDTDRMQTECSPQDSLRPTPVERDSIPQRNESPHTEVSGENVRVVRVLHSPRHWVSVAWALHACRDADSPSMTRPVSYTELAHAIDRHEDSVRRTILQLIESGLIVRTSLLQHSEGGSIYRFEEAFPSLLIVPPVSKATSRGLAPHSLHDSLHPASSSSSSSLQRNSELLQDNLVDQLILSVPFEELDRRSLISYARQMPSVGYLQDFIDKVVAVIDHKKQSAKPIADPAAFLFGCLKKMEINPPPGWKSRAVRMMEEEERRLQTEVEELRAVNNRMERQQCELFFLRLAPEKQAEIRHQTEAVGATDIPMIKEAKREQRYLELIRSLMQQEVTTSTV